MQIVKDKIFIKELEEMSKRMFDNLVKAVVDVEKGIVAVDAQLHVDQEQELLKSGSKQKDLWGINVYPEFFGTDEFIEFDSMINLRPWQDNRSRGIDNEEIQEKIVNIVNKLVEQ